MYVLLMVSTGINKETVNHLLIGHQHPYHRYSVAVSMTTIAQDQFKVAVSDNHYHIDGIGLCGIHAHWNRKMP